MILFVAIYGFGRLVQMLPFLVTIGVFAPGENKVKSLLPNFLVGLALGYLVSPLREWTGTTLQNFYEHGQSDMRVESVETLSTLAAIALMGLAIFAAKLALANYFESDWSKAGLLAASLLASAILFAGDSAAHITLSFNGSSGADNPQTLHFAAQQGDVAAVTRALDAGTNVNLRTKNDYTALYFAVEENHLPVVEKLLQSGAKIDIENSMGQTPLMLAAELGHLEILKLLLDRGASINRVARNQMNALMYAAYRGQFTTFKELYERGADPTFRSSNFDEAEVMTIAAGAQTDYHSSPGALPIVKYLVEHGRSIDGGTPPCAVPLISAIQARNHAVAEYLLAHQANPNAVDTKGTTPLLMSVKLYKDYAEQPAADRAAELNIMKSLLKHGANPRQKGAIFLADPSTGQYSTVELTPLELAEKLKVADAVSLLNP